jgi:hypothetical protein
VSYKYQISPDNDIIIQDNWLTRSTLRGRHIERYERKPGIEDSARERRDTRPKGSIKHRPRVNANGHMNVMNNL